MVSETKMLHFLIFINLNLNYHILLVVTVLDSADLAAWSNSVLICIQDNFIDDDENTGSSKPVLSSMAAVSDTWLLRTLSGPSAN